MLKPVKEEEIQEIQKALFQMHPYKSPGPDGMTPAIFQRYWLIIGKDVTYFVFKKKN